jgi:geranylgeranyl diphosphate synthase, type I
MEPCTSGRGLPFPEGPLAFGARAGQRIVDLLDGEIVRWGRVDAAMVEPLAALRDLVVAGGKRLRPAFCYWAFVGAGGDPDDPLVVDVGAALELLHAFALVHDDVMDGSDLRRGGPAVHRRFADRHRADREHGESRRFGEGAAILVGDFAFVYSDMLFGPAPASARPVFDELRVELCVGQFLDLAASADGGHDLARAELIESYKSAKYTVERPLHLGAALAGQLPRLEDHLSAVGVPLGRAFQLRDDLLGVFGDPTVTGKPVGDDLREGKLTPLIAAAVARDPRIGEVLDHRGLTGLDDRGVADVQEMLVACGAVDEAERTVERLVAEAISVLDAAPLTEPARDALVQLARFVGWRDR